MKIVYISNTDPYWNLAAEEYFLKQRKEDFFLIWQNAPCIVVGRNQNTFAQINEEYVRDHALAVVRRLTGGGAVYHDMGNVNYSFLLNNASDKFGDYATLCQPLLEILRSLGADAQLSGRNDLLIGDKKICGNAQTLWHGRILHHGCILFSADLEHLTAALRVDPRKIQSKGIDSVRSRVTNLSEHLPRPMSAAEFCLHLQDAMLRLPGNALCEIDDEAKAAIGRLREEKYATFDWNYGYAKQYSFQKETRYSGGLITVKMDILENKIADFHIDGDFFGVREMAELEALLIGTLYQPEAIRKTADSLPLSDYMHGMDPETFVNALF